MGPYTTTKQGNRFLIVIADTYSKWTEAEAVPAADATHLRKVLDACCYRWGFPEVVITDCASLFRACSWEHYMEQHSIQYYTMPIYHQRANPVERRNQEIKKALRIKTAEDGQTKWDEGVHEILFNINNRLNASTGFAPSVALFGAPLARPGEWAHPEKQKPLQDQQEAAPERARKIRARQVVFQRNLYPEPREASTTFQPGDEVMVRNFKDARESLDPTWTGPHRVIGKRGDNTYDVERDGMQVPLHIDDLRACPPRMRPRRAPPPIVREFIEEPAPPSSDEEDENDSPRNHGEHQ
ncbi:hypothetical protein NQ314_001160 [Rhamnusium bicolor]|uniref:Integrase catalytic domain-containing protein n=1 Tax=Rhamnusium bicolor TaxID=1586634 RepID=A0AAV8ZUG3_9CUCU|nr:hypothetical protein NQ314_001160 [Rhamnusium bicolor]